MLPADQLSSELERYVTGRLAHALDLPAWHVDPASTLHDLGAGRAEIDELLLALRTDLGIAADPAGVCQAWDVRRLVSWLADAISPGADPAAAGHPLSIGQRALWYLHQLSPNASAYNVSRALRVGNGALEPAVARELMQQIVDRHPMLRTRYRVVNGEPVQVIDERQAADFAVVDARSFKPPEITEWLRHESTRPFDLEHGPVIRARMLRTGREDIMVVSGHHIALDMWSMLLIGRELLLLYGLRQSRRQAPPPPVAEYTDFVRWQESWLASDRAALAWDHWQRDLAGELPVLRLPQDRPRPAVLAYRGGSHQFWLDSDITARLRALAAAERTTMFVALLAAYQAVLHRYSGQDDLVVASPMSGRTRREFEDVVGYFVNLVLIRAHFQPELPFRTHLHRVRRSVVAALEHQDFPFPTIVQRLAPVRDLSENPFLRAAFALQKAVGFEDEAFAPLVVGPAADGERPVQVSDLTLDTMALDLTAVQADLTLMAVEAGDRLLVSLQYDTDLFDHATIARLGASLRALVADAVTDPDRAVSRLALLGAADRGAIVRGPQGAADDCCVHQLVEAQADRTPDATAVSFGDRTVSYRELDECANAVAARLIALGVGPGQRVALCIDRSIEMVVGLLGVSKAGGVYVPLDPATPAERLRTMVGDAQPTAVLTSGGHLELVSALLDGAGEGPELILLDGPMARRRQRPSSGVGPEDPFYVMYTSGTTGRPKGTINLHAGVVNHLRWRQATFELGPGDRVLHKTPYTFDVSVWELFLPLSVGARLVVAAPGGHLDPAYLKATIEQEQISVVHFVPSMLEVFLDEQDLSGCQRLRYVMCGGESLTESLQRRFFERFDLDLHLCYGPTETCIAVTYLRCTRADVRRGIRIGRPISNTTAYLLDPDGQPVPSGVIGEIHIGGRSVGGGYLHDPALTAQRFVADPFADTAGALMYRTGDLGLLRSDGCIEFVGRRDGQVKVRGFRIELGDVEAALRTHPEVRQVIVRADQAPGGTRLVAYLVARTPEAGLPHATELRSHAERLLPNYMVPAAFVLLDRLPVGPTGKIDVQRLPPADLGSMSRAIVAPRTAVEARVASIWERVLGVSPIGVTDDFFEIGGHSLLAVRLTAALEAEFGQALPVSAVVASPTVEQLASTIADHLHRGPGGSWSPVVTLRAGTDGPAMWWVHPSGGTVMCYHDLAARLDQRWPLYALEARGLRGEAPPHRRIEEMAACYVAAIETTRGGDEPVILGGWSLGGVIAFEMAQQLTRRGRRVGQVFLVDAPAPRHRAAGDKAAGDRAEADVAELPSCGDPLLDIVAAGAQALRAYRAEPASFPVMLVCGTEWPGFDTLDQWKPLCDQAEVHLVEGGHHSLLKEPCVAELARVLGRAVSHQDIPTSRLGVPDLRRQP